MVEREHRRRGRVLEMNEREDAPAVSDDRELTLPHDFDQAVVVGAVEAAVPQHDSAGGRHDLLEMVHRRMRLGCSDRIRVEGIVLGLHRAALARVAHAREALGDEPAHARVAGRRQERVGALRPQPVGLRKGAVEVAREARVRERGCLVDDRLRLRREHRLARGERIEHVERDRLRTQVTHAPGAVGRPERADHLVSSLDQLPDEGDADCPARPDDEDSHRDSPFSVTSTGSRVSISMTRRRGEM